MCVDIQLNLWCDTAIQSYYISSLSIGTSRPCDTSYWIKFWSWSFYILYIYLCVSVFFLVFKVGSLLSEIKWNLSMYEATFKISYTCMVFLFCYLATRPAVPAKSVTKISAAFVISNNASFEMSLKSSSRAQICLTLDCGSWINLPKIIQYEKIWYIKRNTYVASTFALRIN